MTIDINHDVKAKFGKRLSNFREAVGLTQKEYAKYIKLTPIQVSNIELGKHSVILENIGKIASSFGLEYHDFVNPNFPIPSLKKMPAALHEYLEQVKQDRKDRKDQPRMKLAAYLDKLLDTKFFRKAHTAAEIAAEIEKTEKVEVEPGKVTALLTKHPRNKRVRTIPGEEWGGRGNKYVLV